VSTEKEEEELSVCVYNYSWQ